MRGNKSADEKRDVLEDSGKYLVCNFLKNCNNNCFEIIRGTR